MLKIQLDREDDKSPVFYRKDEVKWGRDLSGRGKRPRENAPKTDPADKKSDET